MAVIITNTLRELVDIANNMRIQKEDIVTILGKNGQYEMVYYK